MAACDQSGLAYADPRLRRDRPLLDLGLASVAGFGSRDGRAVAGDFGAGNGRGFGRAAGRGFAGAAARVAGAGGRTLAGIA